MLKLLQGTAVWKFDVFPPQKKLNYTVQPSLPFGRNHKTLKVIVKDHTFILQ